MCLKAQEPWSMPKETAEIGAKVMKTGSVYKLVGDEIFGQYREVDFADLYSPEGKPAISPVILAFVTIFQFIEKYPDRQAGEALRMRIDWKYALHLPLEYQGFDFSVLSEFRERLIEQAAVQRVFIRMVKIFQTRGLIKERGKQRTDSIAMLTKVRNLSRLELVVETLRLAVSAILEADPSWGEALIPPSWDSRYGERFVMQRYSEADWKQYEVEVGPDGAWLLSRLAGKGAPAVVQNLPEVQVLKTVWAQQFRECEGQITYQKLDHYDGHTQIQTPHDPEARYSKKRHQEWVGDKVQVTETDDEGYPHLITDMVGTSADRTDYEELDEIQSRLGERLCLPQEHYVDSGYMSGPNLHKSHERKVDLIGPLSPVVTPQDRIPEGITWEQFDIDVENGKATCPAGCCVKADKQDDELIRFKFPKSVCLTCPLHERCCTGVGGRTLGVSPYFPELKVARSRQKTKVFKEDYHKHRSGVEGSLSAMVRGNGLRVGRYIGQQKRHLQAVFTGCGVNLVRTSDWLAGKRPQKRKKSGQLAQAR